MEKIFCLSRFKILPAMMFLCFCAAGAAAEDSGQPPVMVNQSEGDSLSGPIRSQVQAIANEVADNLDCPKNMKDIATLEAFAKHYNFNHPVDTSKLRAYPIASESPIYEPQLPLFCGYNKDEGKWWDRSNLWFLNNGQSIEGGSSDGDGNLLQKNCTRYIPVRGENNLWRSVSPNCANTNSWRDADNGYGTMGDERFAYLGDGVYLNIAQDNTGMYAWFLVFVPNEQKELAKACADQDQLNGLAPEESDAARLKIALLVQKARIIQTARRISEKVHRGESLPYDPLDVLKKLDKE